MEKNLIPAPIDNKNILEEWDWLTNGEELCRRRSNTNEIYFLHNEILYRLRYQFGCHKFSIECLDSFNDFSHDKIEMLKTIRIVEEDSQNVKVDVRVYSASRTYFCSYFFVEE